MNRFITIGAAFFLVGSARVANACPMCFSDSGTGEGDGITAAMLTMLVVTVAVLSGVATFAVTLYRRQDAALVDPAEESSPAALIETER